MRLGDYELLETIGEGAMGVVYRARGPEGSLVAVKLLKTLRSKTVARFERERQALEGLGAEAGFVPLLDAGEDRQGVFLVMPLLTGGCLATRLRLGALSPSACETLARSLAAGLAAAHAQGLVHRDLKPANVLFDGEGRAWIADLGLAKHYGRADRLSRTGEMRGSIGYMAPEQARDAKHVGPPADVFSWGALMFEALTGRRAFDAAQPLDRLVQAEAALVPRASSLCPEVSPSLDAAIEQALRVDPGERPMDGAALLALLEEPMAPPTRSRASATAGALLLLTALGAAWILRSPADSAPAPSPSSSSEPLGSPSVAPSPSPSPSPSPKEPPSRRLAALLAAWPAKAPLTPQAIHGDERGMFGGKFLALGWQDASTLVGVGRRQAASWNARTGEELHRVELVGLPTRGPVPIALDAVGGRMWAVSERRLLAWDLHEGRRISDTGLPVAVRRLRLSPDARRLALASKLRLAYRDVRDGRLLWIVEHGQPVIPHLTYPEEGRLAVVGDSLRVYARGGKLTRLALRHPATLVGAALGRGDDLYFVDAEGAVQRWDLAAGQLRWRRPVLKKSPPASVGLVEQRWLWLAKGRLWAAESALGGVGALFEVDPATGGARKQRALHDATHFAVGADGLVAEASGSSLSLWDGSRRLWPGEGPGELQSLAVGSTGAIYTRGPWLARWSSSGDVRLLKRERKTSGAIDPTPEGGSLFRTYPRQVELWVEGAEKPAQVWKIARRRVTSVCVPLDAERALVGWSFFSQGKAHAGLSLLDPRGQVDLEWKEGHLIAGARLDAERVRLVTSTRYGDYLVGTGAWEGSQPLSNAKGPARLGPGGATFVVQQGSLDKRRLEVWRWGESVPWLSFPLPLDSSGVARQAPVCALTSTSLLWGREGKLFVWDLRAPSPQPIRLPLDLHGPRDARVGLEGEVYVATQRGTLIVLTPR